MNLNDLGLHHGTDKASNHHNYLHIYEKYFAPYKDKYITVGIAGIGGYQYPDRGGQCLRMWRDWFPSATIIGIDVYPKSFTIPGVHIMQLSQDDAAMSELFKGAEIFIDDASHINPFTVETFKLVWPVLAQGGIYVIEDIETSYGAYDNWAKGAPVGDYEYSTAINLCRKLVDNLNCKYTGEEDMHIESISFHSNIIFIKKK